MVIAPKGNYIPPTDRPKWLGNESVSTDLLYLGWGRRYHGKNPPPPYRHPGWLYILLMSGNPIYEINDKQLIAPPHSMIVVNPDSAFGVMDRPTGCCTWLLWIWKEPPVAKLNFTSAGYALIAFGKRETTPLRQIHDRCRMEVARPDIYTDERLKAEHRILDITLARRIPRSKSRASETHLITMAVNWLKLNITSRQPVALLCEYLQISPATLSRLFHKYAKESPAECHQRLRMNWAKSELEKNRVSIKEVAYSLGFRHPGDFSRAYKKFHHLLPTEDLGPSKN